MKKLFFGAFLVVFLLLCVELLGYIAWSIQTGEFIHPGNLMSHAFSENYTLDEVIDTDDFEQSASLAPGYLGPRDYFHPFLGYTSERSIKNLWSMQRSDDSLCVALFGGSVAAQIGYKGREYFEQKLQEGFSDVEVNFYPLAVHSYKQPQQVMQLAYLSSLGKDCDVFINLDGYNEYAKSRTNIFSNGIAPWYPSGTLWSRNIADQVHSSKEVYLGQIETLNAQRQVGFDIVRGFPFRFSSFATFVWSRFDAMISNRHFLLRKEHVRGLLAGEEGNQAIVGFMDTPYNDWDVFASTIADQWLHSSLLMDSLSKNNDARYFHFLQSAFYIEGSRKFITPQEKKINYSALHEKEINSMYDLFRERGDRLREKGIFFQDLSYIFSESKDPVFTDTVHVTSVGREEYIDAIVAYLIQEIGAD